jgi:hypothetical protein
MRGRRRAAREDSMSRSDSREAARVTALLHAGMPTFMKFDVSHTFDGISAADYEVLYFEDAFNVALCEAVKLGREVLKMERTPTRIVRNIRCTPQRDIPAPVAKMIKDNGFHYVEELDHEVGKLRGTWVVKPNILPEKVTCKGTYEFVPAGDKRVTRNIRGDIDVAVFGVGGMVEKFVVDDVKRSYEQAAQFTRSWLAKK